MMITDLRKLAEKALDCVYAPYSNFHVAAVVCDLEGNYYIGANIENAAFNPTIHAEGAAITSAIMDNVVRRCGPRWLKVVYVQCPDADRVAPCGYCRQMIQEFAHPDCIWIGDNPKTGKVTQKPFRELLPYSFGPEDLL